MQFKSSNYNYANLPSLCDSSHLHSPSQLLNRATGLLKLQTALKCQVAHKWCLAISSLMNFSTLRSLEGATGGPNIGGGEGSVTRKSSEPPLSVGMITTASEMGKVLSVKKALQKGFISVQLEKVGEMIRFSACVHVVPFHSNSRPCGITCWLGYRPDSIPLGRREMAWRLQSGL